MAKEYVAEDKYILVDVGRRS